MPRLLWELDSLIYGESSRLVTPKGGTILHLHSQAIGYFLNWSKDRNALFSLNQLPEAASQFEGI